MDLGRVYLKNRFFLAKPEKELISKTLWIKITMSHLEIRDYNYYYKPFKDAVESVYKIHSILGPFRDLFSFEKKGGKHRLIFTLFYSICPFTQLQTFSKKKKNPEKI